MLSPRCSPASPGFPEITNPFPARTPAAPARGEPGCARGVTVISSADALGLKRRTLKRCQSARELSAACGRGSTEGGTPCSLKFYCESLTHRPPKPSVLFAFGRPAGISAQLRYALTPVLLPKPTPSRQLSQASASEKNRSPPFTQEKKILTLFSTLLFFLSSFIDCFSKSGSFCLQSISSVHHLCFACSPTQAFS